MGRDKAEVAIAGRPMIAWVAQALASVTDRVLVAGRVDGWDQLDGLVDPVGITGPLAGLAAALELGESVLLVAVDQPWIRTATLEKLIAVGQTAVPIHEGARQVTCAVYFPELIPLISGQASIQSLLDEFVPLEITEPVWQSWGEDGRSWFSVDTPEDVAIGLERFGPPS
jgi:molybdopterin-guanine dinucleotide biosynthesis protein A